MLIRLPISLARLKAGNNSEKTLKRNQTTIDQLLVILCTDKKKLIKKIYNVLINTI